MGASATKKDTFRSRVADYDPLEGIETQKKPAGKSSGKSAPTPTLAQAAKELSGDASVGLLQPPEKKKSTLGGIRLMGPGDAPLIDEWGRPVEVSPEAPAKEKKKTDQKPPEKDRFRSRVADYDPLEGIEPAEEALEKEGRQEKGFWDKVGEAARHTPTVGPAVQAAEAGLKMGEAAAEADWSKWDPAGAGEIVREGIKRFPAILKGNFYRRIRGAGNIPAAPGGELAPEDKEKQEAERKGPDLDKAGASPYADLSGAFGKEGPEPPTPQEMSQAVQEGKTAAQALVQKAKERGQDGFIVPGITIGELARFPDYLTFSVIAGANGLLAGAPFAMSPVPGSRAMGWSVGTAEAGAAAFKMDKDKVLTDVIRKPLNLHLQKTEGRNMTPEEWGRMKAKFDDVANKHALAEATWEALGQAASLGLWKLPVAQFFKTPMVKNRMLKTAATAGLAGTVDFAQEWGSEILTEQSHGKTEYEIGARKEAPTWSESAKETLAPVALLKMVMGPATLGTNVVGRGAGKALKGLSREPAAETTIKTREAEQPMSGRPASGGSTEQVRQAMAEERQAGAQKGEQPMGAAGEDATRQAAAEAGAATEATEDEQVNREAMDAAVNALHGQIDAMVPDDNMETSARQQAAKEARWRFFDQIRKGGAMVAGERLSLLPADESGQAVQLVMTHPDGTSEPVTGPLPPEEAAGQAMTVFQKLRQQREQTPRLQSSGQPAAEATPEQQDEEALWQQTPADLSEAWGQKVAEMDAAEAENQEAIARLDQQLAELRGKKGQGFTRARKQIMEARDRLLAESANMTDEKARQLSDQVLGPVLRRAQADGVPAEQMEEFEAEFTENIRPTDHNARQTLDQIYQQVVQGFAAPEQQADQSAKGGPAAAETTPTPTAAQAPAQQPDSAAAATTPAAAEGTAPAAPDHSALEAKIAALKTEQGNLRQPDGSIADNDMERFKELTSEINRLEEKAAYDPRQLALTADAANIIVSVTNEPESRFAGMNRDKVMPHIRKRLQSLSDKIEKFVSGNMKGVETVNDFMGAAVQGDPILRYYRSDTRNNIINFIKAKLDGRETRTFAEIVMPDSAAAATTPAAAEGTAPAAPATPVADQKTEDVSGEGGAAEEEKRTAAREETDVWSESIRKAHQAAAESKTEEEFAPAFADLDYSDQVELAFRYGISQDELDEARRNDELGEVAGKIRGRIRKGEQPWKKHSEMSTEELHHAATHDFLTGMKNKAAWNEEEQPGDHTRVMADVDSLKAVNDTWGHAAGDELLRRVAEAFQANAPEGQAYHFSGDEFGLHADPKIIDKTMENVQEYLRNNPIEIKDADGKGNSIWVVPEVTYGTSEKSLPEADQNLGREKERAEARGLRAGRGERPGLVFRESPSQRDISDRRQALRHERGLDKRLTPERMADMPMRDLFSYAERIGVDDAVIDRGDRQEIIAAIEKRLPEYLRKIGLETEPDQVTPPPASEPATGAAAQADELTGDTTADRTPERGKPPAFVADIDPKNTPLKEIPVQALPWMDLSALRKIGKRLRVPGHAKKDITWSDLRERVGKKLAKHQGRTVIDSVESPTVAARKFSEGDRVAFTDPDTGDRAEGFVGSTAYPQDHPGEINVKEYPESDTGVLRPADKLVPLQTEEASQEERPEEMPGTIWSGEKPVSVIQAPSGRWVFVGDVPAALAYQDIETGRPPTEEQQDIVAKAQSRKMGMDEAGVKNLAFDSKQEALDFAKEQGFETEAPAGPKQPDIPESPDGKYQIYSHRIQDTDGSFKDVYAVPSRRHPESRGYGDTVFDTLEEAQEEVRLNRQKDQQDIERTRKEQEEAGQEAKQQAEYNDLDGFGSDLSPIQQGRLAKVLNKTIRYEGRAVRRKDLIREKVTQGWRVVSDEDGRRLESPDNETFLSEGSITKTGMDYAAYLQTEEAPAGQPETPPAQDTAEAAPQFEFINPEEQVSLKDREKVFNTFMVESDGGLKLKRVAGRPARLKAAPDHSFFVCKEDGKWNVVEATVGTAVARASSQKEARRLAEQWLQGAQEKFGQSFDELLDHHRQKTGVASGESIQDFQPAETAQAEPRTPSAAAEPWERARTKEEAVEIIRSDDYEDQESFVRRVFREKGLSDGVVKNWRSQAHWLTFEEYRRSVKLGAFESWPDSMLDNMRSYSDQELRQAHREMVQEAVNDGDFVPEEVISAYPDLQQPTASDQEAPQQKPGYGANNKVFTKEAADAARERLRKKLNGQLNMGLDPEMLRDGIALAGYHIEAGARSFADFTTAMIADLGEAVRPYLRQWYEAVRQEPGFDTTGMTPYADLESAGEAAGPAQETAPTNPAGDLFTEDGRINRPAVAEHFARQLATETYDSIVAARREIENLSGQKIPADSTRAKELEEAIELGVNMRARDIVGLGRADAETFNMLVDLYHRQPILGKRTSTSMAQQAYSTPAPIAFAASRLAGINQDTIVYDPAAGNGMLLLGADPQKTIVNELNDDRAENLAHLGMAPTRQDATEFLPGGHPDVVIANPPFGKVKTASGKNRTWTVGGFQTTEIDHAIALQALQAMPENGRAVLIVGGKKGDRATRAQKYRGTATTRFWKQLLTQYNVTGHYSLDGDLYARQGAGFPLDLIVIDGYNKSNKPSRSFPGAQVPPVLQTFDEVRGLLNEQPTLSGAESVYSSGDTSDVRGVSAADMEADQEPGDVSGPAGGPGAVDGGAGGLSGGGAGSATSPRRRGSADSSGPAAGDRTDTEGPGRTDNQPDADGGLADRTLRSAGDQVSGKPGEQPGPDTGETAGGSPAAGMDHVGQPDTEAANVEETEHQVPYSPQSTTPSMQTLAPRNMAQATKNALEDLEDRRGSVDSFVAEELGYDVQDLPKYFAAEQVDAIGLALDNIKRGQGFIIGDQTGIGKGRVNAAIVHYAKQNGILPVFVTHKKNLYADMIRDMVDIGITDFEPMVTNAGLKGKDVVPLPDGREIRTGSPAERAAEMRKVEDDGLASGYDAVFTTYSQLHSHGSGQTERQRFFQSIAPQSLYILDESHNAGGSADDRKNYQQNPNKLPRSIVVRQALEESPHGAFYSSATYAKRPDVMSLYFKTDMSLAVDDIDSLSAAIESGGVPLQQAVAAMLAESGQYLRRERSFAGTTFDAVQAPIDRNQPETAARIMQAVRKFDALKQQDVEALGEDLAAEGGGMATDAAIGEAGMTSTHFTAIMHNLIDQFLLAVKAEGAVNRALAAWQAGEKPVVAVANTMGSFLDQYAASNDLINGDAISLDFSALFDRYLERSREVQIKDADGNKEQHYLTDEELSAEALDAYQAAKELVADSNFAGLAVSPLDYIIQRLTAEGLQVGELTGRSRIIEYDEGGDYRDGTLRGRKRPNTNRVIDGFNSGRLDALLLNSSASTGMSIHSSENFSDQKKRRMIVAQADKNIDTFMQILGRVFRTGQVTPPAYELLYGDIPAENRPAAILSKKMASLNANTTAGRETDVSATNVPDIMNEYGDRVVAQIMADNRQVHRRLGEPLQEAEGGFETEGAARKVTGRIPLLPLAEQEKIYDQILSEYQDTIEALEQMGLSTLEAKYLDLDARPVRNMELTPAKETARRDSPFATSSRLEEMNVKKQGKPYRPQQVSDILANNLDLEAGTDLTALQQAGRERGARMLEEFERDLATYIEQRMRRIENQNPDNAQAVAEKQQATRNQIEESAGKIRNLLNRFAIGTPVEMEIEGSRPHAVVLDVVRRKKTAAPMAQSDFRVTLAPNAPLRQITLSLSKLNLGGQGDTQKVGVDLTDLDLSETLDEFEHGRQQMREHRYIVTGNVLAGYDAVNRRGRIINFTRADGMQQVGVMLPNDIDVSKLVRNQDIALSRVDHVFRFIGPASSEEGMAKTADKILKLVQVEEGQYRFQMPASRRQGGRYFLNQQLLDAASGQEFVQAGQTMRLVTDTDTARRMVEALMNQGVGFVADNYQPIAREIVGLGQGEWQDSSDQAQYTTAEPAAEPLTADQVRRAFERFNPDQVYEDESGNVVMQKAGRELVIEQAENIGLDEAAFAAGHRRAPKAGEQATGEYTPGRIRLQKGVADEWVLDHESFHWLRQAGFVSNKDYQALRHGARKALGKPRISDVSEEDVANYVADELGRRRTARHGTRLAAVLQKITDLVDGFVNLVRQRRTARGVVADIESGAITEEAAAAHREFLNGNPVAEMAGNEVPAKLASRQFSDWVADFFKSRGNAAVHPIAGEIVLDRRAAKNSIGHGLSRPKAQAFYLLPDVIEKGQVLYADTDRRGAVQLVIGAPVRIQGADYTAVALVFEDMNMRRLRLHEVVLKESLQQESFKTGASTDAVAGAALTGESAEGFIRNVLRQIYDVKSEPAGKKYTTRTGNRTAEKMADNLSDQRLRPVTEGAADALREKIRKLDVRPYYERHVGDPVWQFLSETAPEAAGRKVEFIDKVNRGFIYDYRLDPEFIELRDETEQKIRRAKEKAKELSRVIATFPRAEQIRIGQVIEGSITNVPKRYEAALKTAEEFKRLEAELQELGLLGEDHRFRQLTKKEIANKFAEIGKLEKEVADLEAQLKPEIRTARRRSRRVAEAVSEIVDENVTEGEGGVGTRLGRAVRLNEERVKEALLHRGFAEGEADQMIRRIKESAVAPDTQLDEQASAAEIKKVVTRTIEKTVYDEVVKTREKTYSRKMMARARGSIIAEINKKNEQRAKILERIQTHYKMSGKQYLRLAYDTAEQNDAFLKNLRRYAKNARLKKGYSKQRQNLDEKWRWEHRLATPQLVMKGMSEEAHDAELMRMFVRISENNKWAVSAEDWADYADSDPETYGNFKQLPASDKLGPLAGMMVDPYIYDYLNQAVDQRTELGRVYDELLRLWKTGKVVYNPASQCRNVLSGFILADMGDLSPYRIDIYARAAKSLKNKDENYRAAYENGALGVEWAGHEIKSFLDEAERMNSDQGSMLGQSVRLVRKLADMPGQSYQGIEQFFKLAMFIDQKQKGQTDKKAAAHAEKWGFNYAKIPPGIAWARRWYSPFITFTYKAMPRMAETAVKKPWRMAKYVMLFKIVEGITRRLAGESEDEFEREKKVLPDYMRRDTLPGMPSHVRVPITDEYGRSKYLDLSYILPWGDIGEMWGQSKIAAVPRAWMPSHPLFITVAEVGFDEIMFTGEDLSREWMDSGDYAKALGKEIWRQAMPTLAGSYSYNKLAAAIEGEKDWAGRDRSLSEAVADVFFGLKLRSIDYNEELRWRLREKSDAIRQLKRDFASDYRHIHIQDPSDDLAKQRQRERELYDKYNDRADKIMDQVMEFTKPE